MARPSAILSHSSELYERIVSRKERNHCGSLRREHGWVTAATLTHCRSRSPTPTHAERPELPTSEKTRSDPRTRRGPALPARHRDHGKIHHSSYPTRFRSGLPVRASVDPRTHSPLLLSTPLLPLPLLPCVHGLRWPAPPHTPLSSAWTWSCTPWTPQERHSWAATPAPPRHRRPRPQLTPHQYAGRGCTPPTPTYPTRTVLPTTCPAVPCWSALRGRSGVELASGRASIGRDEVPQASSATSSVAGVREGWIGRAYWHARKWCREVSQWRWRTDSEE